MLNNYLHMFFLNKGADPWPQSQEGAVWVEFPKFCCLQIQWKVWAELPVLPMERDEHPKDLSGHGTFCLLLCLQRELKEPAGN